MMGREKSHFSLKMSFFISNEILQTLNKQFTIIYTSYYVHHQVLDLSSAAMTTLPSPPEPAAGAYKAAVGHFIHSDGGSHSTLVDTEETSLPEVDELKTEALQQLMASAKTLTAREDLLNTLRLDRTTKFHCMRVQSLVLVPKFLQKYQQWGTLQLFWMFKWPLISWGCIVALTSKWHQHHFVHCRFKTKVSMNEDEFTLVELSSNHPSYETYSEKLSFLHNSKSNLHIFDVFSVYLQRRKKKRYLKKSVWGFFCPWDPKTSAV